MFIATLVVGVATVSAIVGAPFYVERLRIHRAMGLGTTLVLAAVGVGCLAAAASDRMPLRAELALCAFPTLVAGALLLLAPEPDDDDRSADDSGPPWWPEFEDAFRSYSRRSRLPVGGR